MIRRLRSAGAALAGTLVLAAAVAAEPPKDADLTCPYLRQQKIDRHAGPIGDPNMGRDVIDNLKRLKQADSLLETAKDLAQDGFPIEAMECCDRAAELCPGSPCAERAADTMLELALGIEMRTSGAEEIAEPQTQEPGVKQLVSSLMDSCHLLMNQGMQHEAAKLAQQAYAIDPQRVGADPLIYKMHLLADSPTTQPAGASEASEPATCPYCPNSGKPIREIMPEMKPSPHNYELEVGVNATGLRLFADCSLSGNVYHMRYKHGRLAIWKTTDAGKTKP